YADEDSWRRFIPPVHVHKGFTSDWVMVRNLLLCLPLSIFVQIVQINYKVFVYLKRHASIVDTTSSEPHYWLVQEPPDKPFERRHYTFNTAEDVESFWFDLMCVCLNTPLGQVLQRHQIFMEGFPFSHLYQNLSSCEAVLCLLMVASFDKMFATTGNTIAPCYLTNKRPGITENIEVGIEPASRNKQVVGGKGQRRRTKKKEVVKPPHKSKKEPRKRTPAHDLTDHQALKRMTRHRVYWSVQEDSIMMLCSVASDLLNNKLNRPFVPHCVVRDLLHAEFDISKDKTSLSVGRRSRYILKNPRTLLNYRICLAEVHQDKALMKLLEENKPANPDQAEDCAKAFLEYMRLLRQKFSTVMDDHDLIIPDSREQIFRRKYNQELVCRVFVQCKKRRLFNRRRISESLEPKRNRGLPILPMSFQMSQSYFRSLLLFSF
ncbi:hypothetical protein XENOCAPTIV_004812, partial [Xenoophorus captivus]